MKRGGLTLIELLVVLTIIVLLMTLLLPVMGAARSNARHVECMSNLRQWGIATAVYSADYLGYLPKPQARASFGPTAVDDPDNANWYNALPTLVGAPRYNDLYDGSKTKQYPNENIWWCPEQRARYGSGGFTGAGNAFDYAFNTVLEGSTNYGPNGVGQHHVRVDVIPQPTKTLMMSEPAARFEYVTISDVWNTAGVSPDRHFNHMANMLFIAGHVRGFEGQMARQPFSGPDSAKAPRWSEYWTTNEGEVVWGSFFQE